MLRLKLFSNVFYVLLIFLLTGRFATAVDMIVAQPGPGSGIVDSGDTLIDCGVDCAANSSSAATMPMPDRSTLAAFPSVFTCGTACKAQCSRDVPFAGAILDPICFEACKAWQLPKCYDISDPLNTTWGEVGQWLYVAGSNLIAAHNPDSVHLTEQQKHDLRPFFGSLVDEVRVHWGSQMLDEFRENLVDPVIEPAIKTQISLLLTKDPLSWKDMHGSGGQTFGLDIYINYLPGETDLEDYAEPTWIEEQCSSGMKWPTPYNT